MRVVRCAHRRRQRRLPDARRANARRNTRKLDRAPRRTPRELGATWGRTLGTSGANNVAKLVRNRRIQSTGTASGDGLYELGWLVSSAVRRATVPKGEHAALTQLGARNALGRRLQDDRLATTSRLLHTASVLVRDVFEPDAAAVCSDVEHGVLARDVLRVEWEQGDAARRVATDCQRGAGRQRDRRRPAYASPIDPRIQHQLQRPACAQTARRGGQHRRRRHASEPRELCA
mmetsp:Transcript_5089/g.15495  ORF Transcript_5089/g.15495 Transcript_5089/m.15495 type:complete len:232 (+) Transcript_5089:483-1178(+)